MIYALLVFLAGCSYGVLSTFVKLAYQSGFKVDEVTGAQNYFGFIILIILVLLFSRKKIDLKSSFSLISVGITTALTSIFYYKALQTLPAAIAVVLLFQFTWVGIIIEGIALQKFPNREKILSLPFLFLGTLMAGGIFKIGELNLTLNGFIYGMLSALTFSLFIFFSGRVANHVPVLNKSLLIVLGSLIVISIIYPPKFILNGSLSEGLTKYGLVLGFFGMVIPPLLFAKGVPKVGTGLSTILSSSELPVAVLMSALILKEPVTILQWIGIFIILLGICTPYILISTKKKLV